MIDDAGQEEGRVAAEHGRVAAESSRVEAEGTGTQGEESRVDAEIGREDAEGIREDSEAKRVKAEEDRDSWWHRNQSAVVGLLCAAVVAQTFTCIILVVKFIGEAETRRDENCLGWEKAHKQEITDLKRTFAFYKDPPPGLEPLLNNPLSALQVRDRVRNAHTDLDQFGQFVPQYCDEPGVGAPEVQGPDGPHDPKVPETPVVIKRLLQEFKQQTQPGE